MSSSCSVQATIRAVGLLGATNDNLDGVLELPLLGTGGLEHRIEDDLVNVRVGTAATAEGAQQDRRLVLLTLEVDIQGAEGLRIRQALDCSSRLSHAASCLHGPWRHGGGRR